MGDICLQFLFEEPPPPRSEVGRGFRLDTDNFSPTGPFPHGPLAAGVLDGWNEDAPPEFILERVSEIWLVAERAKTPGH